ncbi:MAG: hypothetical protein II994_04910 [Lachnospiraceae bacterium]|nr:hypothetical protein [Lachnospiraceae bacterium]
MKYWRKWNRASIEKMMWIPGILLGVIFLLVGIWQEQLQDMYQKAVVICLECIGIG